MTHTAPCTLHATPITYLSSYTRNPSFVKKLLLMSHFADRRWTTGYCGRKDDAPAICMLVQCRAELSNV